MLETVLRITWRCQRCGQASTCLHADGEWCGACCPYERAVQANGRYAPPPAKAGG